jgi:hypothetical protein
MCSPTRWPAVSGRTGLIETIRPNISFRANGCVAIVEAVAQGKVDAAFGWSSSEVTRNEGGKKSDSSRRIRRIAPAKAGGLEALSGLGGGHGLA